MVPHIYSRVKRHVLEVRFTEGMDADAGITLVKKYGRVDLVRAMIKSDRFEQRVTAAHVIAALQLWECWDDLYKVVKDRGSRGGFEALMALMDLSPWPPEKEAEMVDLVMKDGTGEVAAQATVVLLSRMESGQLVSRAFAKAVLRSMSNTQHGPLREQKVQRLRTLLEE